MSQSLLQPSYLDTQTLSDSFFYAQDSALASADESEGKRIWAQIYYMGLAAGLASIAEINNTPLWTASGEDYVADLYIYPVTHVATSGAGRVAGMFAGSFYDIAEAKFYSHTYAKGSSFWTVYKQMFNTRLASYDVTLGANRYFKQATGPLAGRMVFVAGFALAFTAAVFYAQGQFSGSDILAKIGIVLFAISTVVMQTAWTAAALTRYVAITQLASAVKKAAGMASLTKSLRHSALVSLIITVIAVWGMFGYLLISGQANGKLAFSMLLAFSIAATLIALLIFVFILMFPVVGSLIYSLITLIDAILTVFGVTGLNDRLTEWLADALYDVYLVITNLDDANRLTLSSAGFAFVDEADGFTVQNGFYYTLAVTNLIEGYQNGLDKSTFTYTLATTAADIHSGLALNQMNNQWTVLSTGIPAQLRYATTVTTTVQFASTGVGLNQDFNNKLYLNEGYAVPYRGCWVGFIDCTYYTYAESNHLNLGAEMVYDILPNTLSGFVALNWANNSTLSFPVQTDKDGDGLLSTSQGGTDPSDGDVDTDGDGLTDVYEISYGLNAEAADADSDGLTDKEELTLGSNPADADSDDDGLGDYTELITGWLIVYNTTPNATTRIWSDPNAADADGDSLNDLEEFVFGTHPEVESDPSIIKDIIQFSNMGVSENNTPQLWLRLEEATGLTTFTDISGADQYSACVSVATCPTAEASGRYGDALLFDGSNDQITTTTSITLAKGDFTIGLWVKTTTTLRGLVNKSDGDTSWESGEKTLYLDASGKPTFVGFGNGYIQSTQAITDGTWHHVAVVWDYAGTGTSGTGKIYVDGVNVTGVSTNYAANTNDNAAHTLYLGRPNYGEVSGYFIGRMDEVVMYNRALTSMEVVDLYYGRHNANDLVVQPGQDLTYQATITNTSGTQSAAGFLTGQSQYADPLIAQPEGVFRFEQTDYVGSYYNGTGESSTVTCLGNGTCPRTTEGAYDNGVKFDGVDDVVYMPYLDQRSNQTIAFWLKTPSWPTTGTVDYILDTEDTGNNSGAIDVYLNSSGYLVMAKAGVSQLLTSTLPITRNTWVHVVYVLAPTQSLLYLDAGFNTQTSTSSVAPKLGAGILGNNISGTAAYGGSFDELVIYNTNFDDIGGALGISNIDKIRGGVYSIDYVGFVPLFLAQFQEIVDPAYDGLSFIYTDGTGEAYCASTATCPVITTTAAAGHAVNFDGSNDAIIVASTNYTITNGNADITWASPRVQMDVRPRAYPSSGQKAYLFDTVADGSGRPALDVYLNSSGKVVIASTIGVHTSTATLPLNTWTQVKVRYGTYQSGPTYYFSSFIYFNGVLDSEIIYATGGTSGAAGGIQIQTGPGYLGNSQAGTSPFNGGIDGFSLVITAIDFDLNNFGGVSELNNITGAAADCPNFYACPMVDSSGAVGSALKFDGVEDYLTLDNESDYDFNQFTVAAWIKVASSEFTKDWQAIVTKGDSAWRLTRYANSHKVAFGTTGLTGVELVSATSVDDGQWHHIAGVYDGNAKYLYVDGVLDAYATVTGTLGTNNYEAWIGNNAQYSTTRSFKGSIDEVVVIPAALGAAGITALMNSVYPAIDIPAKFITYTVAALTSTTASGTFTVETTADTSQHLFEEEVEAALQLQTVPSIPVVDANSAYLGLYFPFEDTPGATTFENVVSPLEGSCAGTACPIGGVRGMVDRAAYFDGVNDRIYSGAGIPGHDGTWAAWVKASRGTLMDTRGSDNGTGFQLDFNRFAVVGLDTFSNDPEEVDLPFELPQNEWVHVVATIDDSYTATVYVNGAFVISKTMTFGLMNIDLDKARLYMGGNVNQADFLQGYLDDVRVYSKTLSASEVQTLYTQSTPKLRFEFDEEDDATTFADSAVTEAIATPLLQSCATLTLDSWRLNSLSASTNSLFVALDGAWATYDTYTNVQSSGTLNIDTALCDSQSLSVGMVQTSGVTLTLGTRTLTSTTSGTASQTFSSGGTSVTLTWTVGSEITSVPNPAPGTDGQIGNTAFFNGAGYAVITNATTVAGYTNTFTIMGWINPDAFPSYQWLFANGRTASNNGYGFGLKDDNLLLSLYGVSGGDYVATNYDLDTGLWQHVAVVFDSSYDAYFYVDGLLVQSFARSSPALRNTDDPLYIGASTHSVLGYIYEFFTGQMDELAVYDRALSAAEVESIYLRELRWYRDQGQATVTVDTDDPVITYPSDYAYRADDYVQLAVSAVDTTSAIALLDFGLKAPSATTYTWASAPACADTGISTNTWCPYFDPSTLEGEGAYQVQFRAVDSVGNETTSSAYTLYVDDTAPTASSTYSSTWSNVANGSSDDGLDWTLTLTGTVADGALTNLGPSRLPVSGSGVYTGTVMVSLVDGRGAEAGGGAQLATVTGTTWSVTYALDGVRPSGTYSVVVTAEDNVANQSTTTVGTMQLDERPPLVAMRADAFLTTTITNSVAFTGVVSEQPAWGSAVLHLPLEQITTTPTFADYSPLGHHAFCTDCPTAGGGTFGMSAFFRPGRVLTVPITSTLVFTQGTVSAWIVTTFITNTQNFNHTIVAQRDATSTRFNWQLTDDYQSMVLGNGTLTQTLNYHIYRGDWTHVALVFDSSAAATAYVNGLPVGTFTQTLGSATNVPLLIGAAPGGGETLQGFMDEVWVFDRALSDAEIYALAQKNVAGLSNVQIGLQKFMFNGSITSTTWQTATLSGAGAASLGTNWSYSLPTGLEDFYQVHARSTDNFGNQTITQTLWRGVADMLAPRLTFTGTQIGGGYAAQTQYTLTVNDLFVDPATLVQPCTANDLSYGYDANSSRLNSITASCRKAGAPTGPVTATACDYVGRCTTLTITPTTLAGAVSIAILTPTARSTFTATPATIAGGAYDPSGIQTITVKVDGGNLAVIPFSSTVTNTLWSTSWTPTLSKTYTLTAVLNPVSGGPYTDVITVTYQLPDMCFAEINGDNVTDYSSVDAAALRNAVAAATTGTVKLAGSCVGVTAQSGLTQTAYLTQSLTLLGGYTPANWLASYPLTQPTTLDAQGGGRVLYSTQSLTLTNLIVQNGVFNANGGGVSVTGALWLSDTRVISNTSTTGGGGGLTASGPITLTNTSFYSNTALLNGGGLYNTNTIAIASSVFQNNRCTGACSGGAASTDATLTVTSAQFYTNTANVNGGALHGNGNIFIATAYFQGNRTTTGQGGGARAIWQWGHQHCYQRFTVLQQHRSVQRWRGSCQWAGELHQQPLGRQHVQRQWRWGVTQCGGGVHQYLACPQQRQRGGAGCVQRGGHHQHLAYHHCQPHCGEWHRGAPQQWQREYHQHPHRLAHGGSTTRRRHPHRELQLV